MAPGAVGVVAAALGWWLLHFALDERLAQSLLPLAGALLGGTLVAVGLAGRHSRRARELLGPLAIATAVCALGVTVTLVVRPSAMERPHLRWMAPFAWVGLGAWLFEWLRERRTGTADMRMTSVLAGLALSAVLLQGGHKLHDALFGDYVRAWNVYHYYLGAKYFDEVGHFDLYRATLRADDDWQAHKRAQPRLDRRKLTRIPDFRHVHRARDMRTYRVLPRSELVRDYDPSARFSASRWQEFGEDTRWLRRHLRTRKWEGTLVDLGYNPTPAWTAMARPLSNLISLQSPAFRLIANSDVPLYLGMLGALWWAFGARAALLATLWMHVIVFNRSRFSGGFLQYDWLASTVLGLALYARGHPASAGVTLSWGIMTRGFPVLLVLPIAARWLLGWLRRQRGEPATRKRRRLLVALGLACTVLGCLSLTTQRGLGAWTEWAEKIAIHSHHHPVTHTKRIGIGRLALHSPTGSDFWAVEPGPPEVQLAESVAEKHWLQAAGGLLLLLALARRRDEDAFVLMTFGVFLLVTTSRYYGSIWLLLCTFGLARRPGTLPATNALLGAALLFMAATHGSIAGDAGRYFLTNYQALITFGALCVALLVHDWRELRGQPAPARQTMSRSGRGYRPSGV